MNVKGYTLPRTLKVGLSVLMWIVYDQYQYFTGYWDSSTFLSQEICILSHAHWDLEIKEVVLHNIYNLYRVHLFSAVIQNNSSYLFVIFS